MTCAFEKKYDQFVACGGLDNLCTIYKFSDSEDAINRAHRELTGHDGYLSHANLLVQKKLLPHREMQVACFGILRRAP